MVSNKVSGILSLEAREIVLGAIDEINEALDFAVDLTVEERKKLSKMGDKSWAFVDRAYELAMRNPDFLPRSFNLEEMKRDVELFRAMHPLIIAFKQLNERIDDTYKAVGADAFSAALAVYNYAKLCDSGLAMDDVLKEMGRRFGRRSKPEAGVDFESGLDDIEDDPADLTSGS